MKVKNISDLPAVYLCRLCESEKPIVEMMVVHHRKENIYRLRPRCKKCHNDRERGNRRDYKTKYQQKWRKNNESLNRSYWKNNPVVKEQARINAANRTKKVGDALLIQGRMRRRGMPVGIEEARELLAKFGRCYPSPQGLTKAGLRECERIRSRLRLRQKQTGGKVLSTFEIRFIVYEDGEENGFVIEPDRQPQPYVAASKTLKKWHQRNKKIKFQ